MNKKGDISMNMIIMAIIALLVLAVVAYLIFQSGGDIEDAKSCTNLGGTCVPGDTCTDTNPIRNPAGSCEPNNVCCTSLGNNKE